MHLPPDLVLFDCDGVLVDSERTTQDVISANLGRHGLVIAPEEVGRLFIGGTLPSAMEEARRRGADLPDDWVSQANKEIFAAMEHVKPVPGIETVLDVLDARSVPFAVCSNAPHGKMDVSLRASGLEPRLRPDVYSREDVQRSKPAPDVYLHAARIAGIPPERCAVIEDSPTGARAGKAAGMWTLGYAAETDPALLSPDCDLVFDDMFALPTLLGLEPD